MNENENQKQALIHALDLLGLALANHGHTWKESERSAYDNAQDILNMYDLVFMPPSKLCQTCDLWKTECFCQINTKPHEQSCLKHRSDMREI